MRVLIVIFTGNLPVSPSTIHVGVDIFTPGLYFKNLKRNLSMIFKFSKHHTSQPYAYVRIGMISVSYNSSWISSGESICLLRLNKLHVMATCNGSLSLLVHMFSVFNK